MNVAQISECLLFGTLFCIPGLLLCLPFSHVLVFVPVPLILFKVYLFHVLNGPLHTGRTLDRTLSVGLLNKKDSTPCCVPVFVVSTEIRYRLGPPVWYSKTAITHLSFS